MELHVELQNDYRSMKDELASIKEHPKFIQSENVQKPPASGHEDDSAKQNICIKENLSSVTNNGIRDSELNSSVQSNKIVPAFKNQDTKVNSFINIIPMDNSTQLEESKMSTHLYKEGEDYCFYKKDGSKKIFYPMSIIYKEESQVGKEI